jgi:hypothetical protein
VGERTPTPGTGVSYGISELTKPVCPRCGGAVDWYEKLRRGDREYLYAVHVIPGTKKRHKCYLGPIGGYVHAKTTHPMLSLRGFEVDTEMDWKRRVDYVLELLESFKECDSVDELRRLLENLAAYLPRLAKLTALLTALHGGVAAEYLVSLATRLIEVAGEVAEAETSLLTKENKVEEAEKAVLKVRAKLTDAGMAVHEVDKKLRGLQNGIRRAA